MFCRLSGWTVLKWYWLTFWHPSGRLDAVPPHWMCRFHRTSAAPDDPTPCRNPISLPCGCVYCISLNIYRLEKYLYANLTGWMRLCFFFLSCAKCLYDVPFLEWYVHFRLNVTYRLCWVYSCMEGNWICQKILNMHSRSAVAYSRGGRMGATLLSHLLQGTPIGLPLKTGVDTGCSDHLNTYVWGSQSVFFSTEISRFILLLLTQ